MALEGSMQCCCTGFQYFRRTAIVDILRGHEGYSTVAVFGVIPTEKRATEGSGILQRAKTARELRAVFECLELRLGEWIVVAYVGPAMRFGNAEV